MSMSTMDRSQNENSTFVKFEDDDQLQNSLFQHFCNNLYFGQWQLARASAELILKRDSTKPVIQILKDVSAFPFNRNVFSPSLSSPVHLSWLCLIECEKQAKQETSSQFEAATCDRKLLEFQLLLLELSPHITDNVLKEIYLYHTWIHSTSVSGQPLNLSSSLLKSLQSILSQQPQLGSALISALHSSNKAGLAKNNRTLQLVYINTINNLIECLSEDNLDNDIKADAAAKICDILAHFIPDEERSNLPLRPLFSKLLECCRLNLRYLSRTKLLSVLVSHSRTKLVQDLCDLDYELETNNAVASYQACAELTEEQRWLLHLATLKDINARWRMFLLYALKKKRHLLEIFLETGLTLIKCSMFDELQRLLEPPELYPLKPLLLLLGWTYCYSSSEARQLLQILWTDKTVCGHPAITMGCDKLAYQIDLIQWCLDKAKPFTKESSTRPQFQRAVDLFKGFETHSVLYVLHNATQLSALDQQEVLDLLQKVPLQGRVNEPVEKKKTKTVRFKEESQDNKPISQVTNIDQSKDIAIYMAYCILKNVMDAILYCSECSEDRLKTPIRSRRRRQVVNRLISVTSQESVPRSPKEGQSAVCDNLTCDTQTENNSDQCLRSMYKENVTDKLAQTKIYLSKLQPLTLRVELLEDIFSLLFVSHEDIHEALVLSEYNSDDGDEKSRGASTGADTPLYSPVKNTDSTQNQTVLPKVSVQMNSDTNLDGSYDMPFEDTKTTEKASDTEKSNGNVEEKLKKVQQTLMKANEKQERIRLNSRRSSQSENISSMSTSSSANVRQIGFLTNEYLVRDILALLKDCILDVSAARYQIHGNKMDSRERYKSQRDTTDKVLCDIDPSIEETLCRLVKSSVTVDGLQKKITQLERYTSEAHWRFQLVSHSKIPKETGEILLEPVCKTGDSSDEEVDIAGLVPSPRKRRKSSGRKSPRAGMETPESAYSDAGMTSEGLKRQMSIATSMSRANSLISLMLSSPITLLTMAIRKAHFTQTNQIIKLFKLEGRPETCEVFFSQAYQKASRSIQTLLPGSTSSGTSMASKPSIKSLGSVAAAGVASASIMDVVDEILTFPTMPQMPNIQQRENLPHNISNILKPENLPVMILLDLLCSSAKSWEVCNHLLDVLKSHSFGEEKNADDATPHTLEPSSSSSKQRVTKIKTLKNLLSEMTSILQLGAEEEFQNPEQTHTARLFQKSIQYYHCQSEFPIKSDRNKVYMTLCQHLTKSILHVEESLVKKSAKSRETITATGESPGSHYPILPQESPDEIRLKTTSSNQNQPAVHFNMKKLIQVLEKEVPSGGVITLHGRQPRDSKFKNRNYLLSLYEHCRELAYLVAESESAGKDTHTMPENYFTVLEEGPLRILGHMMFHKKMQPIKLEKVAKKLSLNLTHIIVYSCCMKVPSKRLPALHVAPGNQDVEICNGKMVLNCARQSSTPANLGPEELTRTILTQLLDLMKDIALRFNAEGLFDGACAAQLANTAGFYDIITQTSALQSADLLHMEKAKRRCFYGNLQTLMTIHCFVMHIHNVMAQEGTEDRAGPHRAPARLYGDLSPWQQVSQLSMFSYRVGQLGVLSLFDLKFHINRNGLLPPSELGRTLEHRLLPLDDLDPLTYLAPPPNPQLIFSMATGCISSPPIKVLFPDTLMSDLGAAMRDYLQTTVVVDITNKVVRIPEMLLWHRRDFICEQTFSKYVSENLGLIAFVASQLAGEKEKDLTSLLGEYADQADGKSEKSTDLPFELEVIPHHREFIYVFDFDGMGTALKHAQNSSQSENRKPGSHDSTASDIISPYNLTLNTLEYIKLDFPLVATLVSLMCSDEMEESTLEDAFEESHFNESIKSLESSLGFNRSRTSSSMSLVDMRSYRYEKLTYEYPTIKRRLLNYFIPLAAAEDHDVFKGDDPILKYLTSDSMERFKTSMLSLHESVYFQTMLSDLLNELFGLRKWSEILQVIDFIPVNIVRSDPKLVSLHDFVVCCLVHSHCNTVDAGSTLSKEKSKSVTTLLHRMKCANMQAHEVMAVHQKLPIDFNMELYEMCLSADLMDKHIREAMQQKYRKIKVYYRITECAKNLQIKLSLQTSDAYTEEDKIAMRKKHAILDKFTDWLTVMEWTKTAPKEVLALLIKTGDFDTANSWSLLENLDDTIKMEIEENHIVSLLNAQPPKTTEAFMLLEKFKIANFEECLTMCQKFVSVLSRHQDVMFIASYMVNHLSLHLDPEHKDHLRLTYIGAKMIMCLPESMHIEYCHLISQPRYILEQLIMNMKPDLAGKAYQTVQGEFDFLHDSSNRFSMEQFNTLIALYAKKALEFTVIQYLDLEKERSFSMRSTSSDKFDPDQNRLSPFFRHSPHPESLLSKRKSMDVQGSRMAVSAPEGVSKRASSPAYRTLGSELKDRFVMPAEPPPRDQWVPDSKASVCMVCKVERFSMFTRRHHCRRCGRVVCAGCSSNVTPIKGINARTCDDCFREIVKSGDQPGPSEEVFGNYNRPSSLTASPLSYGHHTESTLSPVSMVTTIKEERSMSLTLVVSHTHTTWKLQTDDLYNSSLREDFYFEQAPSTSLCISVLNLHNSPRECGQLILTMCDDLSKVLKPLAPGIPNPEVDYNLIMSMMKYLLFHAKMKFTKCGYSGGMAKCDMYQGLVDLLGLLVTANYKDLPSIQELTKMDSVRRLRDKLIEDERLKLAMEVSTKCGLDPTGVWVAWGMMLLQTGDFPGAREKFSKCLKPPKDKNVCSPLSKVLSDIVECLEAMQGQGAIQLQYLLSKPGSVKHLISTPSSRCQDVKTRHYETFYEETSLDSQQFQECVFYLKTYGSYLSLVDFHRRHGYYMKDVQYVIDHRCSTEVFTEGLLKPSIQEGELGRLMDHMLMIDPSLEKWNTYLKSACLYLYKNKLHNILYEFQIFMKDFIRAGMTCYTYFYQEGATSYLDLSTRVKHLFTAQQHMQAYLDPAQWGMVPHPLTVVQRQGSWEEAESKQTHGAVRMVASADDVKRQIKTIALQIEITKFLSSCLTGGEGEATLIATKFVDSAKLPTLFLNTQARNDLTIMVLLSGNDVESSFALATRIIKEYKLGSVGIYTHAAREMAKAHHYDKMRQIVSCVEKAGMGGDEVLDEILGACLLVVADIKSEAKEAENIIKLLRKDANKINAYILCGKLRSAYLMAVKDNRVDDVKRILRAAKSMGQSSVINICNKWLEQNQTNS